MKSDIAVPAVLVDRITDQYSQRWKRFARSCATSVTAKIASNNSEPAP